MDKCKDVYILKKYINNLVPEDKNNQTIGKSIFRFNNGLVCTVFDNGTVQFQGTNNQSVIANIKNEVKKINDNY